jgi:hypothetical protein
MKIIEHLSNALKKKKTTAFFNVQDTNTKKEISKGINYAFLSERYNSDISEYFNSLKIDGYTNITVFPRLKNSNSSGDTKILFPTNPQFDIKLNSSENTPTMQQDQTTASSAPNGLGFIESVKAFSDASRLEASQKDLTDLKVKYEAIKKEKEALKDQHTAFKITEISTANDIKTLKTKLKKSKKGGIAKTVQGLAGSPDGLAQILAFAGPIVQMIKGTGQSPTAAQNTNEAQLSQWQQTIVKAIEEWPENALTDLYSFIQKYGENAPGFKSDLDILLNHQTTAA